jgi:uncharacterized protein (TIGR02652 family)
MSIAFGHPFYGATILCPHCRQTISALTLTDTYLCHRHGAFEVSIEREANGQPDLVHLQSGRRWRMWQGRWFRQHTHADGIRFEIHEELDRLRMQGMRATQVTIAQRYQELLSPYLEQASFRRHNSFGYPRLYGLPVVFSAEPNWDPTTAFTPTEDPHSSTRWQIINFELTQEKDPAMRKPQDIRFQA